MEMARSMAKICQEKLEERVMIPVESFDGADQRQMRVSLRYGPLTRLVPQLVFFGKALKTGWFSAASRFLSKPMASYHLHQINRL